MFVNNLKEYNLSFSKIAWCHVQEIQKSHDPIIKKQILGNFNHLIRTWSGNRAKLISKAALELFSSVKPEINPFDIRWEQRNILGTHSQRKPKIVWEHSIPVGQFIKELSTCKSFSEVETKMNLYPGVCWITREEDDALNSNGYKNSRPDGFKTCYTNCGIEVISEEELNSVRKIIQS
jgi:hypothetical protein